MECYKQLYIDNFATLDETAISQKPQITKIQPRWNKQHEYPKNY